MADVSSIKFPQISRSGRVLKKSVKLKESEEFFYTDEADVEEKSRKKSDAMNRKSASSASTSQVLLNTQQRPKQTVSSFKHPFEEPGSIYPSLAKASENCLSSSSKKSVLPVKISKISRKADDDDSTYSVTNWSAEEDPLLKSANASATTESYSTDSIEESSSGSSISSPDSSDEEVSISEYRNYKIEELQQQQQQYPSSDQSSNPQFMPRNETNNVTSLHEKSTESNEVASELTSAVELAACSTTVQKPQKNGVKKSARKRPRSVTCRYGTRKNTTKRARKTAAVRKTAKKLTSYILWNHENRKKILALHKNLSAREVSQKVGEAWKALPEKEKALWKRKAKQMSLKGSTAVCVNPRRRTTAAASSNKTSDPPDAKSKEGYPKTSRKVQIGTAPIDVAAHLKLLGDSLTAVGTKLIQLDCQPSVRGVESVLLDSLLCAIGPLLCLTRKIPGLEHLPENSFQKTLDHIAYFFPGL